MGRVLWVGFGGFIGTALRYLVGGWIARARGGIPFPVETLVINVAGCVVIGFLAGLSESRGIFAGTTRAFVFIGVLGGFTTFSTFGYETVQLMRDGESFAAALNVVLQVGLGLGGVWAGLIASRFAGGA